MVPTLTQLQAIAVVTTVPLLIFIVIHAFDVIRAPTVRWGHIKSTLYLTLLGSGTSISGVFAYSLATFRGDITPPLCYAIATSVLSTYLYTNKTVATVVSVLLAARKKAKLPNPDGACD